jgi:hypothetical protein
MKTETNKDAVLKIAKRAQILATGSDHGWAVKMACAEAGKDTPEMRSVVSAMVANYEINGRWPA